MTRRYPLTGQPLPRPGERTALDDSTSHAVLHVHRVPRGTTVELFDGGGSAVRARLVGVARGRALVEGVEESVPPAGDAGVRRVLALAQVKRSAFHLALRMATELGVTEVHPLATDRSQPLPPRPQRWERILAQAAAQCGRRRLPRLHPLSSLPELLDRSSLPPTRLVLCPGAPAGLVAGAPPLVLLVGPEGGLTNDEVRRCEDAGFRRVGLGTWTLRTETAVAAALARYAPPGSLPPAPDDPTPEQGQPQGRQGRNAT